MNTNNTNESVLKNEDQIKVNNLLFSTSNSGDPNLLKLTTSNLIDQNDIKSNELVHNLYKINVDEINQLLNCHEVIFLFKSRPQKIWDF